MKKEEIVLIGDDETNVINVGRSSDGRVMITCRYPRILTSPAQARELAKLLIKAADRIERGDVPLAGDEFRSG